MASQAIPLPLMTSTHMLVVLENGAKQTSLSSVQTEIERKERHHDENCDWHGHKTRQQGGHSDYDEFLPGDIVIVWDGADCLTSVQHRPDKNCSKRDENQSGKSLHHLPKRSLLVLCYKSLHHFSTLSRLLLARCS